MALAPVIDLHPPAQDGPDEAPGNIEAEQALLGILLCDNAAFDRLPDRLRPDHFREPLHGRIFETMLDAVRKGRLAAPILLCERFKNDPAFDDLGGARYLGHLIDLAPPTVNTADYALEIVNQATRRALVAIGAEMQRAARLDTTADVEALVEAAERELHALIGGQAGMAFTDAQAAAEAVLERLDHPPETDAGVAWGLAPLDKQLGPLLAGDLIVLGGRTSMGKSALAAELALNIGKQGKAAIEINGEMTVEQMTRRHLTSLAFDRFGFGAPSYSAIRKREVTYDQRQMLQKVREDFDALPISMLKRTGLGFGALRSLIRREQARRARQGIEVGAAIIDHVGLIRCDTKGRSRYEDQTEISNGLKELADELKIPIVALAQLNREVEKRDNKRPILADLRDSGAWEQDADIVIGIYRDAYYAQREPEPKDTGRPNSSLTWGEWDARRKSKIIEAIVLKVREGETGPVELWGDMATNAIRAREPETFGGFL